MEQKNFWKETAENVVIGVFALSALLLLPWAGRQVNEAFRTTLGFDYLDCHDYPAYRFDDKTVPVRCVANYSAPSCATLCDSPTN
jgi:hypothetical protein